MTRRALRMRPRPVLSPSRPPHTALAESLLIVQSSRSTVADAAVAGFRSVCPLESPTFVLSD